jgi:ribosomal protein S18 acetylase RimI-like enzyme
MELRAPQAGDADAVFAALVARDLADIGEPDGTVDDLRHVWRSTEVELERDMRVAEVDGEIRGYVEVRRQGSLGVLTPGFEGRGIGSRLLAFAERRERERGTRPHRQLVASTNELGREFLQAAGYTHALSHYRMERELADFEGAPTPAGLIVRSLDPEADAVALHALDAASFAGSPDYEPMSADAFREAYIERPSIDRGLTCIAERGGAIVGFAIVLRWQSEDSGHVGVLAVAPDQQAQGIGTALLSEAFNRIKGAGLGRANLGVVTTNPRALRLYERIGMTRRFRFDTYERPLEE